MRKDPTEFRKRFAAWKNGKLPYKGGRPSAISEVDKSDADFAERLRSNWRQETWDWEGSGKAVTHKIGSADNIVYPNVQTTKGGGLIDFTNPIWKEVVDPLNRAIINKDYVPMKTELDAIWFGPNYKEYYPKFRDGKLPGYAIGTPDNEEVSDATYVLRPMIVRPIKKLYGKVVDPKLVERKLLQQPVIKQGKNYTQRRIEEETKRTWLSDAADVAHAVGEGATIASGLINPEVSIAANIAYDTVKNTAVKIATSNLPTMQYLRYPIGKMIYGIDAKFPTLYRKIKAMPTLPENGFVQISNPKPRFAFQSTGEESPIITNFTYDAPVRKHASGNWDGGFTLAIPGRKALLGKNVISTEPSDLFTYGDNIWMPVKDLTLMTGSKDEAILAQLYGYNVYTNPILLNLYEEGASPGVMFTTKSGRTLNLRKEDFHKYAKQIELDARKLFGSPTQKDVNFMNFVLLPKVKGLTYNPNTLDYLIREGIEPFGDRVGNAELRSYLLDSERWGNLLYDPATHAEANFRNSMGIVEKKDIPLNMRKFK